MRQKYSVITNLKKNLRAPKLKIHPGEFYQEKGTGQIYCVLFCYTLAANPSVWNIYLEERSGLAPPGTPMSTLCDLAGGGCTLTAKDRVSYLLWHDSMEVMSYMSECNQYMHGDSKCGVPVASIYKNYTLVSSGEILA